MKCQTILLKKFFGPKGAVYYEAIAMAIFSHVKITCYFHMWRYQVSVRKLTWYFIGVYITKSLSIYLSSEKKTTILLGSLSNVDCDCNGKKAIGLDWQNNNFANVSRFFCTLFLDIISWLQCKNAYFHVLSRTGQGAKKVIFTACQSGKLKLAFTSPNIISTSPQNFLMNRIDFTLLL